jgi:hypothetical protein
MPLFNSAVIKMAPGCELTEAQWMSAVKEQDMEDSKVDRMHHRFCPLSVEEMKEQENFHTDSEKTWEQVQGECNVN